MCRGAANCWDRGSFDRGDLKEVAGATGRAMEPQAVFGSFAPSHWRDVPARNSGEAAFDIAEFGRRGMAEGFPQGVECVSIAGEHTNAPAHESTWSGRRRVRCL